MKYAQLLIGLLAGSAIGGTVVAGTGPVAGGASVASAGDAESVKKIVREVISQEPKLIIDSLQKYQSEEQKRAMQGASDALKDPAVKKAVYESKNAGIGGNKDGKKTVVEFFDYNCGACKMMYKSIDAVLKKDKDVRVIFHEYPIFGPVSDTNAKIGLAVSRVAPDKYFDFHIKMLTHEGRTDEAFAYSVIKDLGLNVDKVKEEAAKKELDDVLAANRELGAKLRIQGTPTLVIGDEVIPHALSPEELESRLNGSAGSPE